MDGEGGVSVYPAVESVVAILGGRRGLGADVRTVADLSRRVAEGLPFRSLGKVTAYFPPSYRARVEQLVVPRTTMGRRAQAGVLSREESERLERVARVTTLAEQVLESREDAQRFLTSPHPLLDGDAPLDLAATDLGARRVEDVLWRLEYGLPV
jgi:putative toxin-antitoxin system antitoxin component (TIGR02293 family)